MNELSAIFGVPTYICYRMDPTLDNNLYLDRLFKTIPITIALAFISAVDIAFTILVYSLSKWSSTN